MKEWLARIKAKPFVAHILRTNERFISRFGNQFSAAITYFSVLALVPTLMMAFSILGFFMVELRPELIPAVADFATSQLKGVDEQTETQIETFILSTLQNYTAIGLVGLATAMYSGAGWMGNLNNAIDAQWKAVFDPLLNRPNIVVKTAVNLIKLFGLLVFIAITFGLAAVSTTFANELSQWLGGEDLPALELIFRFVPIILSIAAGWLTFCYIFWVHADRNVNWVTVRRGALIGAIGLAGLQYVAGLLFNLFSGNRAAAVFGPVIVLMIFFNLFATLILYVAAWIATYDQPAVAEDAVEANVRFALRPVGQETTPGSKPMSQEVAARSTRVGMGAGYLTGAATGLGLGAVITFIAAVLGRRRR